MVIAAESRVHPDIASVILARGLVPDGESIRGWMSVEGDGGTAVRDPCRRERASSIKSSWF